MVSEAAISEGLAVLRALPLGSAGGCRLPPARSDGLIGAAVSSSHLGTVSSLGFMVLNMQLRIFKRT